MAETLRIEPLPSLAAARTDWESLAERNGNLFATYDWAEAWCEHLAGGATPMPVACRRADGSVAAIIPLVAGRERGLRMLRLIGHGPSDQLGPICAPADRPLVAEAMGRYLAAAGADLFIGDQMPAEERWGAALGAQVVSTEASPVLEIGDLDWDGWLAQRSRNFRQQVRRRERKLADAGELEFRLCDDPARLEDGPGDPVRPPRRALGGGGCERVHRAAAGHAPPVRGRCAHARLAAAVAAAARRSRARRLVRVPLRGGRLVLPVGARPECSR